jgi:hypothetical protein
MAKYQDGSTYLNIWLLDWPFDHGYLCLDNQGWTTDVTPLLYTK